MSGAQRHTEPLDVHLIALRDGAAGPEAMEHHVCDAMGWFALDALPEPMVAYCRAGLDAYRAGARMAVHLQEPGDPITYDPSVDRLRLVPEPAEQVEPGLRAPARQRTVQRPPTTAPPTTRSSTVTYTPRDRWDQHYRDGKGWQPLGPRERQLFAEHAPVPDGGGRALDVGCGTGQLAAHLAEFGYTVDAVDFSDSAIARAREEHADIDGARWLRLDVERDDPAALHEEGYDLIVMRLVYPFMRDRGRVVRGLGERLRGGGALVVITPTAEHTPADRRGIALDEDEITLLGAGWEAMERLDADGLAFLVLRGPGHADGRAVR
ncbi:methyltransferase [Streptomyces sp. NPDC059070]|uniref:methyltransferase n=1 Tax=Streptomyces sp. NPDC059070 TaxID=3346713 RepID=UPI00368DAA0E